MPAESKVSLQLCKTDMRLFAGEYLVNGIVRVSAGAGWTCRVPSVPVHEKLDLQGCARMCKVCGWSGKNPMLDYG